MSQSRYVASVGNDDKERLSIQHDSFLKGTEEFLKEINISKGMNVLVVGCGGGDETVTISKKVGPSGSVTAIDISPEQIQIAQEKIDELKLQNVTLKILAAEKLDSVKESFDIAYCRMVLVHISDPKKVLNLMLDKVKSNGVLACEEPDISTCFTIPKSGAFEKHIGLLCKFIKSRGCDPDLGTKTYTIFKDIGCLNIKINFFQPAITDKRLKKAASLSAKSCAPQYISLGLATESEVNEMISKIEKDVVEEETLLGQCRMTQIYGRKK
jgi:ubiquinone/menaquinone biosynthesis C-methylase UbiE